jgi:hypothetical protein
VTAAIGGIFWQKGEVPVKVGKLGAFQVTGKVALLGIGPGAGIYNYRVVGCRPQFIDLN